MLVIVLLTLFGSYGTDLVVAFSTRGANRPLLRLDAQAEHERKSGARIGGRKRDGLKPVETKIDTKHIPCFSPKPVETRLKMSSSKEKETPEWCKGFCCGAAALSPAVAAGIVYARMGQAFRPQFSFFSPDISFSPVFSPDISGFNYLFSQQPQPHINLSPPSSLDHTGLMTFGMVVSFVVMCFAVLPDEKKNFILDKSSMFKKKNFLENMFELPNENKNGNMLPNLFEFPKKEKSFWEKILFPQKKKDSWEELEDRWKDFWDGSGKKQKKDAGQGLVGRWNDFWDGSGKKQKKDAGQGLVGCCKEYWRL